MWNWSNIVTESGYVGAVDGMGLPLMKPYLDSVGAPRFKNGCNFATGGSTILPAKANSISPFSFGVQVAQFLRFKARALELLAKSIPPLSHSNKEFLIRYLHKFYNTSFSLCNYARQEVEEICPLERRIRTRSIHVRHRPKWHRRGIWLQIWRWSFCYDSNYLIRIPRWNKGYISIFIDTSYIDYSASLNLV